MVGSSFEWGGGLLEELPLARQADELTGKVAHVVSSDSGPLMGVVDGIYFIPEVSLRFGKFQSRQIYLKNLVSVEEVEFVSGRGDASSHGASWENFRQTVKATIEHERLVRSTQENLYHDRLLEGCTSMAAEGSKSIGGGWTAIFDYLTNLQTTRFKYYITQQLEGLYFVASDFAERESKELKDLAQPTSLHSK